MEKSIVVASIGRTGDGKSSLLNTILKKEAFKHGVSKRKMSTTVKTESNKGFWRGNEKKEIITCIDTPGILDEEHVTTVINSHLSENLELFLLKVSKDVNCFLIVFNIFDIHFGEQTQGMLGILKAILGDQFLKHSILVFTHCDDEKETWKEKKNYVENEFKKKFLEKYKVDDIPLVFVSSKLEQGFEELYDQVSKINKFESKTLQTIKELEEQGKEKELKTFLAESIYKGAETLCNIL